MTNSYFYPDVDDKVTFALINEREPIRGYWKESEKRIIKVIRETLAKHSPTLTDSWLLDAGCGGGRLLVEFQDLFGYILAIDPDSAQIEKAMKLAKTCGFANKVTFLNTSAELLDWGKESVNVVLCSHVIQHVNTNSVPLILQKFHEVLKKNGLLFIMTAHARKDHDCYAKGFLEGKRSIEVPIAKEEFNSIINNDQNILPLHFFTTETLFNLLERAGFLVCNYESYHIIGDNILFSKVADRDELVNSSDQLKRRFGRDIYLACQKLVK